MPRCHTKHDHRTQGQTGGPSICGNPVPDYVPVKRIGTAGDMADATMVLFSASYITGIELAVDGGVLLRN
jgi:NAD(P)-dependent dehydrogenase (short-subunit alcohol dehydrogenase family)